MNLRTRLETITDLHAVNAIYHNTCYSTLIAQGKTKKIGRPVNNAYAEGFQKVRQFIEDSDRYQFMVDDLLNLMGDGSPTRTHFKKMLLAEYGEDILFSTSGSSRTILTFRKYADRILTVNFQSERVRTPEDERNEAARKAAKIIAQEIRLMQYQKKFYPAASEFLDNAEKDIPEVLSLFLTTLILEDKKSKKDNNPYQKKIIAISHTLISAVLPNKFISTVLLSLAVYLHRRYESRLMIEIMSRIGFSASYDEVRTYEKSCVFSRRPELDMGLMKGFSQLVFDNADINVNTCDGHNTFHYTGGILIVTPGSAVPKGEPLPRLTEKPSAIQVAAKNEIEIVPFQKISNGSLKNVIIKDIYNSRPLLQREPIRTTREIVWAAGKWLHLENHPGFFGFMERHT